MNPMLASVHQTPALGMKTPMRQPPLMSMPGSVAPKGTIPRTHNLQDERPIRERAHQAIMLKAINDFLREHGKDTILRSHPTPSAKDFQETFLFIYNIAFDDDLAPGSRKMDEEVVELLRIVRYPWIDSLAKLSFSIITPHVWPQLLGSLYWMVAGQEFYNSWMDEKKDPNLMDEDELEETQMNAPFDETRLVLLFLSYLGDNWLSYCQHNDDFSVQRGIFMDVFEAKLEQEQAVVDGYEKTIAELREESAQLKLGEDAEERLKAEITELDAELDRCQEVKRGALNKIRQHIEFSKSLDADIKMWEDNLAQLTRTCAILAEDVKRQNISPEEVSRMFRERETLLKQFDDLSAKELELQNQAHSLSVSIFREADSVELLVEEITNKLDKLKLHPKPPAPFAPGDFHFTFNRATDDLDAIITGADISPNGKMVKNLSSYAEKMRRERADLASQAVRLENELDVATTELDELRKVVDEKRTVVKNMLEEHATAKKAWEAESNGSRVHLETIIRETSKIKMANQDRGMALSTRLDALRLEKNETSLKLQRLMTKLIRDLVEKAEQVTELKAWTSERLESLTRSAQEDDLESFEQLPDNLDASIRRLSIAR